MVWHAILGCRSYSPLGARLLVRGISENNRHFILAHSDDGDFPLAFEGNRTTDTSATRAEERRRLRAVHLRQG